MAKGINSRAKGKRGESGFAKLLTTRNLKARRGQQFSGGAGSPDVVCEALSDVHFEVKYTEVCKPYGFMAQARRDAGEHKKPVVAFRKNGEEWLAIMDMDFALDLLVMREGTLI